MKKTLIEGLILGLILLVAGKLIDMAWDRWFQPPPVQQAQKADPAILK